MKYVYKTKGTCSTLIELELEGNIVHNVKFTGGCNGNLQAIPKLVEGLTVEQVEQKIGGISCNGRGTSCGDQLAKAFVVKPMKQSRNKPEFSLELPLKVVARIFAGYVNCMPTKCIEI